MLARRSFSLVLLAVALTGACSDTSGPEDDRTDANGTWTGSLSHPAYDGGSLTLTLTDANGAVNGSYLLRLAKRVGSRVSVEQSSGRISGSSTGGRLTLIMERADGDDWFLEGRLDVSAVNGEWSVAQRVRGTFSVTR